MSDKLNIKIGNTVRIGIIPPQFMSLNPVYSFLIVVSFLVILVALFVLSAEIFNLPLTEKIYQLLRGIIPFNF